MGLEYCENDSGQKMNESTKNYIHENERLQSLPKRATSSNKIRRYKIYSISWLISKKLKVFRELAKLALEVLVAFKFLIRTINLANSKKNKNVLILGNGPSQGYLNITHLENLRQKGVEIIAVNYINQNKLFEKIPPNYLVISDAGTLNFSSENWALKDKNDSLLSYLNKNKDIKVICAALRVKNLINIIGQDRIAGAFIDSELIGITDNILPLFPRDTFQ